MRIVRAGLVLLALSVVLIGLSACGGGNGEKSSDTPSAPGGSQATAEAPTTEPEAAAESGGGETVSGVDPCTLVTKADAEAVLGASVGEPKVEDTPPVSACTYETADLDSVQVVLTTWPDTDTADAAFQEAIDINNYEEISGIGDRAFNAQPIFDVDVLKGKYDVSIDVVLPDDQDELAVAEDLAATAVDRLP